MKFIILKNQYQQDVIVNLANVSIFFQKAKQKPLFVFKILTIISYVIYL